MMKTSNRISVELRKIKIGKGNQQSFSNAVDNFEINFSEFLAKVGLGYLNEPVTFFRVGYSEVVNVFRLNMDLWFKATANQS